MRIVGIDRPGPAAVQVAALSEDGDKVTVIAPLGEFWSDAAGYLTREPAGPTLPRPTCELVPPVLPGRQGDLHRAELPQARRRGQLRATSRLPEFPTLFARWTRTLTVDGAAGAGARRTRTAWTGRARSSPTSARRWSTPPRTRRWPPSSATRRSTT